MVIACMCVHYKNSDVIMYICQIAFAIKFIKHDLISIKK